MLAAKVIGVINESVRLGKEDNLDIHMSLNDF